jgi:hypothetical protein
LQQGDDMNGKWWRYAIAGFVLFALCLFLLGGISLSGSGTFTAPWGDGLAVLQNIPFEGCLRSHLVQNLTAAAALLLTMTLS